MKVKFYLKASIQYLQRDWVSMNYLIKYLYNEECVKQESKCDQ